MADKASDKATIRTRKFKVNRLLKRKQMVVDIIHHGRANVPKTELAEKLSKVYKTDAKNVILYGFRTKFGGGRSTGFALIYDDITALKSIEPKFRQVRFGHATKVDSSRKQKKERKNRAKKIRGARKYTGGKEEKKKDKKK
eukprot:TRINITY_DN687_c0_g1_i1.p1 TRINITY_DN687_c0_g1~~TRINITY_DN687_c0_g1_i1.p1  ORF type:complete len:141 (-),score=43.64 TRINITY_DN687_c0_g1_i1:180-602(-)